MKIGICGYGNLGKAVEKLVLQGGKHQLVGIFSRREVKSLLGSPVYDFYDAPNFENDIDVMIMCGGSQQDLLWQSPQMLKHFNIIDTFDTHAKIDEHKKNLNLVAAASNKTAIYSCGWDPGIFSMMRVLSKDIFGADAQTFWGKGVSQGHSEALRNISGVADAIQFTIPDGEAVKKAKQNPSVKLDNNLKHKRLCYVALDGSRPIDEIENEIANTENYFKGQQVIVKQASKNLVKKLSERLYHKGMVLAGDDKSQLQFSVKMENNPTFTAQILLAYTNAIKNMPAGVYSVLDIPLNKLDDNNEKDL